MPGSRRRPAATGVYGLSNAGLDTPWPKLIKAKAALGKVLDDPQPQALLDLLATATGPCRAAGYRRGLATETLLSSVFIASQSYGTRASTALIVHADGRGSWSSAVSGRLVGIWAK
jgi:uncharacterized protein with NRDE domain